MKRKKIYIYSTMWFSRLISNPWIMVIFCPFVPSHCPPPLSPPLLPLLRCWVVSHWEMGGDLWCLLALRGHSLVPLWFPLWVQRSRSVQAPQLLLHTVASGGDETGENIVWASEWVCRDELVTFLNQQSSMQPTVSQRNIHQTAVKSSLMWRTIFPSFAWQHVHN